MGVVFLIPQRLQQKGTNWFGPPLARSMGIVSHSSQSFFSSWNAFVCITPALTEWESIFTRLAAQGKPQPPPPPPPLKPS